MGRRRAVPKHFHQEAGVQRREDEACSAGPCDVRPIVGVALGDLVCSDGLSNVENALLFFAHVLVRVIRSVVARQADHFRHRRSRRLHAHRDAAQGQRHGHSPL
eukprot:scaffold1505_cov256-Pinguiococcus_pyrenoidosus.AAC.17